MKKYLKNILLAFIGLFTLQVQAQNYFPPKIGSNWDTLSPQSLGYCQSKIDSLYHFLDSTNTKAFILLKDGKIVLEKYLNGHNSSTAWYWASAGKSLMAFTVGIAQDESLLKLTDTTSHYLGGGWTSCTPSQEGLITVRNQLTMTSGLDDGVPDIYCTDDTCLKYKADAGTRWAYHNGPYTLLDSVIQSATGGTLNNYVTTKIGLKTGMTGSYIKSGYNRIFFSTPRSMAKFGLLNLAKGIWDGDTVLADTQYFNDMINTSQSLNLAYGYLWWLNGKNNFMLPGTQIIFPGSIVPSAPADMYAAIGANGQIINVVPSQNLVWIRMGNSPDTALVPNLYNDDIWKHLNALECGNIGITDRKPIDKLTITPSLARDFITIDTEKIMDKIEVFSMSGERLVITKNKTIDIGHLPNGVYIVKAMNKKGQLFSAKFIKY